MHTPWGQISDVSLQLVSAGFSLASKLVEVNLSELHAMALLSPSPLVFRAVWSSARAAFDSLSSAGEYIVPAHELFTNDALARAIRRRSAQYAVSGQIDVRARRMLRAPVPSPRWGPRSGYAYLSLPLYFIAPLTAMSRTIYRPIWRNKRRAPPAGGL